MSDSKIPECVRPHLSALYAGQRDLYKALNHVTEVAEAFLKSLEESNVKLSEDTRENLSALCESLENLKTPDLVFQAIELNMNSLRPEE